MNVIVSLERPNVLATLSSRFWVPVRASDVQLNAAGGM